MSSTMPFRLRDAIHEAVALQRDWLLIARADMEPGLPEPCGASDAYVAWALQTIAAARTVTRSHPAPRLSVADRLARQAGDGGDAMIRDGWSRQCLEVTNRRIESKRRRRRIRQKLARLVARLDAAKGGHNSER